MLSWESIERGFEAFLEVIERDARLGSEFQRSRGEFFASAIAAASPGAERRHLEWFALERPSAVLGAVPIQAWQELLRDAAVSAAFLQSLPGAFEVTSLVHGDGLWVRDLFTQGEHPIAEPSATNSIEPEDLLVGRLFPAGGGTFLLSPAVSAFRNPELLAAVRRDLGEMRAVRRGVLRVQQLELERLFHSGAAVPAAPSAAEARVRARTALVELGLPPELVEKLLRRVRRAAGVGTSAVVIEILNQLAFESGVDLADARLVLTELWEHERPPRTADAAAVEAPRAKDARDALDAFDRGRAQGRDLDQLFRQLERDLGLAGEVDEEHEAEDEEVVPDFPGVVGAMVEEFLWEVGREEGEERARSWSVLRKLGEYGKDMGVFEELDAKRLLDFVGRWLLDESGLTRAEGEVLLDALAGFCRWSEERHALSLWKDFGATLANVRGSLPRHLALRELVPAGKGARAAQVVCVERDHVRLRELDGRESSVPVSPAQAEHLREGDYVRVEPSNGSAKLVASYPAEIARVLGRE